jgi:hypothetical protein
MARHVYGHGEGVHGDDLEHVGNEEHDGATVATGSGDRRRGGATVQE